MFRVMPTWLLTITPSFWPSTDSPLLCFYFYCLLPIFEELIRNKSFLVFWVSSLCASSNYSLSVFYCFFICFLINSKKKQIKTNKETCISFLFSVFIAKMSFYNKKNWKHHLFATTLNKRKREEKSKKSQTIENKGEKREKCQKSQCFSCFWWWSCFFFSFFY